VDGAVLIPGVPRRATGASAVQAAEAVLLFIVLVWGINFIAIKAAIAVMPPLGLTVLRFGIAGCILLVVVRWREGSVRWPPGTGVRLFVTGAIGFGVYQLLWVAGLQFTSAGTSAILIAVAPVFTALFGMLAGVERGHPARFGGAAISLAGVALVAGGNGFDLRAAGLGDLLTVAAAACWGIYLVGSAPVRARMSPLLQTTWVILAGTAVLAGPGFAQLAQAGTSWIAPGPILAIAFSAVFAVALANALLLRALPVVGPTRIANVQLLVPVVTLALGAMFIGEPILPTQVAGGAIIVAGILVSRRAPVRAAAERRTPEPLPIVEA